MKIDKLTIERLQNMQKSKIPEAFISNLMEGNKEVKNLLPEIYKIDKKIGELCEDVFERMSKNDIK